MYRNIIAPLYKFFYYIPHLYEIAEPSTLVNGRDERTSPAADKCVRSCLCGRQESESNECFRPYIVCFFLYLSVSYYITTRNLGTKVSKIIVLMYASMCKKVSIYNGFHSSRPFDSKKQILFFIYTRNQPILFAVSLLRHCKHRTLRLSLRNA